LLRFSLQSGAYGHEYCACSRDPDEKCGLVVLAYHRRKVVHFNVTEHPTAQWTGQQIIEAFPWDTAPRYLLRDRDGIYGIQFQRRVKSMGIEEVLTAP